MFAAVTGVGVVSSGSLLLRGTGVYRPLSAAILIAILLCGERGPARRLAGMVRQRGSG